MKQSIKNFALMVGIYPVLCKIHYRMKLPEKRCRAGFDRSWTQIVETLEQAFVRLENTRPPDNPSVLVLGHIAAFDKGVCGYLNRLSQRMNDHSWVLISETPSLSEEVVAEKIHFPVLRFPLGPFAGGMDRKVFPKNVNTDIPEGPFRTCMNEAAQNMCAHFPGTTGPYARFLAKEFLRYCNQAMDVFAPEIVVIWNQFVPFHRIMEAVCRERDIPCVYMEFGSLAGTLALDNRGQMGESLAAVDPQAFMEKPVSLLDRENAEQVLRYLERACINRNDQNQDSFVLHYIQKRCKGYPTVVYFGQSDFEAGLCPYTEHSQTHHSPAFSSSAQALWELAQICRKNRWKLIYKPHPAMDLKEVCVQLPPEIILATGISIYSLFTVADAVVTIASQCSYEALIHHCPVVMLGYNQLKGKGCTYEAFCREEIETALCHAIKNGFTKQQEDAFVTHTAQMLKCCLYDDGTPRPLRYGKGQEAFAAALFTFSKERKTI